MVINRQTVAAATEAPFLNVQRQVANNNSITMENAQLKEKNWKKFVELNTFNVLAVCVLVAGGDHWR